MGVGVAVGPAGVGVTVGDVVAAAVAVATAAGGYHAGDFCGAEGLIVQADFIQQTVKGTRAPAPAEDLEVCTHVFKVLIHLQFITWWVLFHLIFRPTYRPS